MTMVNINWSDVSDIRHEASVAFRRLCDACKLTPQEKQAIEYRVLRMQQDIIERADRRYGEPASEHSLQ